MVLDASPAPAARALTFAFNASSAQIVARLPRNVFASNDAGPRLCLAADWSHSHGYLPNVLVTECAGVTEQRWDVLSNAVACTVPKADAPATQCLDAGSGGSGGDLGFRLALAPAPTLAAQAYRNASLASWGGAAIGGGTNATAATYHLFAAAFRDAAGLKGWQTHSEVVHATASRPTGPYTSMAWPYRCRRTTRWCVRMTARTYYFHSRSPSSPAPTSWAVGACGRFSLLQQPPRHS